MRIEETPSDTQQVLWALFFCALTQWGSAQAMQWPHIYRLYTGQASGLPLEPSLWPIYHKHFDNYQR